VRGWGGSEALGGGGVCLCVWRGGVGGGLEVVVDVAEEEGGADECSPF